ncbi:6-bladed beta-propeller [Parabacteroides sp. Marseille-P3160]|uniref:6-bladed beta-propeller n=1 Tax=Parabacteroides sp. Marseille-P3160 TaxID=1917887 RepID=UPI0009BA8B77|nr:6-bladed beta-propeller [Parabacteroides sp. Marseille-P3160]
MKRKYLFVNNLLCIVFFFIAWGCSHNTQTEKHQGKRDKVIHVREQVKTIRINEEDVMIGSVSRLYLIDNYLLISSKSIDNKLIHIFDRNNFKFITSICDFGQAPGEITNIGHIAINESNRSFYVSDHGKQRIFSYDLDSVLNNPSYLPQVKMVMNKSQFPSKYKYINDTLSIGLVIEPIGTGDYKQSIARWNMNTEKLEPMKYEHPDIKKKRVVFDVSEDYDIYVECYSYYDLMTICNLNGELKYTIYGPNWESNPIKRTYHYNKVSFCKDKILAIYSGKEDRHPDDYYPTIFFVFDINGNYIKTIDVGYKISDYCYDEKNNRIILSVKDEIQFAYFSLDGII